MNTLLNTSYRMARVNIPPLSLAANGVTVLASSNTVAGNEYVLNGVSYLVVGSRQDIIDALNAARSMNTLCTTKVADFTDCFSSFPNFNQNVLNWDMSNAVNLTNMFKTCQQFNQDIGSWDVSNVNSFSHTFDGASAFNSNIGSWDVSSAADMENMFNNAASFNQPVEKWDVSNVTNMDSMFASASIFNQDLSDWCVTNLPTQPTAFDSLASAWTLPRPVWGTCP